MSDQETSSVERELERAEADLEAARARVDYWQRKLALVRPSEPTKTERPGGLPPLSTPEVASISETTRRRAQKQIEERMSRAS